MQTHNLKRVHKNKKTQKVGRGGKRGKTSGRGTKGQLARSGRKLRPELRDIIKKLPKLRGRGKNSNLSIQTKPVTINIETLEVNFESGARITPATLVSKGIIKSSKGRTPRVKLLGAGEVTKNFTVSKLLLSEEAKNKIEKAGGKVA